MLRQSHQYEMTMAMHLGLPILGRKVFVPGDGLTSPGDPWVPIVYIYIDQMRAFLQENLIELYIYIPYFLWFNLGGSLKELVPVRWVCLFGHVRWC